MSMSSRSLSYREESVDDTLDNHEKRISRVEKVVLVVMGYGLAEGSTLANDMAQFLV